MGTISPTLLNKHNLEVKKHDLEVKKHNLETKINERGLLHLTGTDEEFKSKQHEQYIQKQIPYFVKIV